MEGETQFVWTPPIGARSSLIVKTQQRSKNRKRSKPSFRSDFSALEKNLRQERKFGPGAVVMTPERMIIELGLTPKLATQVEKHYGVTLRWFAPAYAAMRRHGLLAAPRTKSWDEWIAKYRERADAALKGDKA